MAIFKPINIDRIAKQMEIGAIDQRVRFSFGKKEEKFPFSQIYQHTNQIDEKREKLVQDKWKKNEEKKRNTIQHTI